MVWIYLFIAIAFEVAGTLLLKYSHGFEKVGYGMAAIACYSVCFWFSPLCSKCYLLALPMRFGLA